MLEVGDMLLNQDGVYAAIYNVNTADRRYSVVKLNPLPLSGNKIETITFPDMDKAIMFKRIKVLEIKHNAIMELLYAKQSD